jgi:hypothetical protein
MRETLLDHRELQNGRDEIQLTRKPPAACRQRQLMAVMDSYLLPPAQN